MKTLTNKQTSGGGKSQAQPLRSSSQKKSLAKVDHTAQRQRIALPEHKDPLLSCRYELKYWIRESKARAIARYVQSYIHPDKNSTQCPDFAYPISSLYFDSETLHLCNETIEGKTNRFKLRVRCYEDNPESPCFFEIKRRFNSVILKDRARMPKSALASVVQYGSLPDSLYKKDREVLGQFQLYLRTLCARPIVLVRYMRQAFEGDLSNRVRVTFDRQLSFRTVNDPIVTTNGSGWKVIPMDFVILEIKFTACYPLWLSEMVKIFDLTQTSMSKYVSSVQQACGMGFLCSNILSSADDYGKNMAGY